jgi:PTS system glucose-specific IIC component
MGIVSKVKQNNSFFGEVPITIKNKNSNAKEVLSKLSRGIMLPIAVMAVAGMMIGVGSALTSKLPSGSVGYIIGDLISYPGSIVFACLPMFFAVAIAITFTKDSGIAGLCALLG